MPTEPASKSRGAADPTTPASLRKKQILVVVLAVGLVIAILTQPDSEEIPGGEASVETSIRATSVTHQPIKQPTRTPSPPSADEGLDPEAGLLNAKELSRIELPEIVKLNFLDSKFERSPKTVATQIPEVQAVYGTSQGRAALVGDAIVRGGQILPGGVTVVDVTEQGIQVGQEGSTIEPN
jgi:hypothetical protein